MATLYKSILIAQPNDGDTVYMRRFTRDPPVLATWNATAQQFTLANTPSIIVIGGTYAGTHPVAFAANFHATGKPAWWILITGVYLFIIEDTPGNWIFQQSDLVANAYEGNSTFPTAPNRTETSFTTFGAPSWSAPTSMTTNALTGLALVIPAYLVAAWRPQ